MRYVVRVEEIGLDAFDLYVREAGFGQQLERLLLAPHRSQAGPVVGQRDGQAVKHRGGVERWAKRMVDVAV